MKNLKKNLTWLLCFGWIIVCRRFGIAEGGITAISSVVRISSRTESLKVLAIFDNSEYVHILKKKYQLVSIDTDYLQLEVYRWLYHSELWIYRISLRVRNAVEAFGSSRCWPLEVIVLLSSVLRVHRVYSYSVGALVDRSAAHLLSFSLLPVFLHPMWSRPWDSRRWSGLLIGRILLKEKYFVIYSKLLSYY